MNADGPAVYATCVTAAILILLLALLMDMRLIAAGEPSISDFLRANPAFFWGPVAVIAGMLTLFSLHLFWVY